VRSDFKDGLRSGVMARRLFYQRACGNAFPVSGLQMRLAADTSA
jgi:hypothetical protein